MKTFLWISVLEGDCICRSYRERRFVVHFCTSRWINYHRVCKSSIKMNWGQRSLRGQWVIPYSSPLVLFHLIFTNGTSGQIYIAHGGNLQFLLQLCASFPSPWTALHNRESHGNPNVARTRIPQISTTWEKGKLSCISQSRFRIQLAIWWNLREFGWCSGYMRSKPRMAFGW